MRTRRAGWVGVMVWLTGWAGAAPAEVREKEFLLGGDISALTKIEEQGGVFYDGGVREDAIGIMRKYGCNCFRLCLFVNPTKRNVVVNDLAYTIKLAKRIKAAGGKWLLNFHYSDTWADPGHQTKPRAWAGLTKEELEERMYRYTRESIEALVAAGVRPEMVQPGNEIAPGILWPEGKLYGAGDPAEQWETFSRFLKAAIRGVKEGGGERAIRIVLHIHCGGNGKKTRAFFEQIEQHGVAYDIIGLSYYPWWHGSLEDLRENLRRCATHFGKDVFVVETAYPYRAANVGGNAKARKEAMRQAQTAAGQQEFLAEVVRTLRATPGGHGLGVLWWYPESIPVRGLRVWNGGATALFDERGEALSSLKGMGTYGLEPKKAAPAD